MQELQRRQKKHAVSVQQIYGVKHGMKPCRALQSPSLINMANPPRCGSTRPRHVLRSQPFWIPNVNGLGHPGGVRALCLLTEWCKVLVFSYYPEFWNGALSLYSILHNSALRYSQLHYFSPLVQIAKSAGWKYWLIAAAGAFNGFGVNLFGNNL